MGYLHGEPNDDRGTKSESSLLQTGRETAGGSSVVSGGDDEMGKQKVIHKIRAPLSATPHNSSPAAVASSVRPRSDSFSHLVRG